MLRVSRSLTRRSLVRWLSTAGGDEHAFQAETKQLLDMVTNSLYTDKEVFVREIVSNASDALEKLRYHEANGLAIEDATEAAAAAARDDDGDDDDDDVPADRLRITISADAAAGTLTLADSGVGMTEEELHSNLGTIARSGSKAFVQSAAAEAQSSGDVAANSGDAQSNLIGQFGVGFYSAFMVADKVEVYTRSWLTEDAEALCWSSDGLGAYTVTKVAAETVPRGSKVVLHLKDETKEFAQDGVVERIIKKYSNFVNFPIFIGEGDAARKVNTVQALWASMPQEVTTEEHEDFYKFVANAYDAPMYTLHFRTDAPIEIKSLFYIGQSHAEKYGMGRMEPGVSLYSRKVLIEAQSKALLPDWMRFAHGVVDSEDIPLNISRETMQDSALIQRIRKVLTKRFIKFLEKNAKDDATQYGTFWDEFGHFIKEGICTDYESKDELAKLLRFSSSALPDGELTSLDEYLARCPATQTELVYLGAPDRQLAESSAYMEMFEEDKTEVLFLHSPIDEFVMSNLAQYNGRKFVSAESGSLQGSGAAAGEAGELDGDENSSEESKAAAKKKQEEEDKAKASRRADAVLSDEQVGELVEWVKSTLSTRVSEVRPTERLKQSPAIIVDHESASMRKLMRMVETQDDQRMNSMLPKQTLDVNPHHPIMIGLHGKMTSASSAEKEIAEEVVHQVFDNALVGAGVMDDSRAMLPRMNKLLAALVEAKDEKEEK